MFKDTLSSHNYEELNHKHVSMLDDTVNNILNNLSNAFKSNCESFTVKPYAMYKPTDQIQLKMRQLQAAINSKLTFGFPNTNIINQYKFQLLEMISNHRTSNWESIIDLASKCRNQPELFWKKFKSLMEDKPPLPSHLNRVSEVSGSEDSDFGEEVSEHIIDPQLKADFISSTWKNVFRPNNIHNQNTSKVDKWYKENRSNFFHEPIINHENLIDGHPLLRPISNTELQIAINSTQNKTPGPSGVRIVPFKYITPNYAQIIICF